MKSKAETCERCLGTFVPANARQRFCGASCRVASHKQRAAVARDPGWRSWPHTSRAIRLAADLSCADEATAYAGIDAVPADELRAVLAGAMEALALGLDAPALHAAYTASGALDGVQS